MDNLLTANQNEYESYILYSVDEQERKVHTPYVEPQDFRMENSQSIRPISQKIQFTLSDMAMAKKAKSRKTKTIEDPNSNKKCGHWSSDQNKRYHWFLELHQEHFFNKHLRRTDRIFKSMATFVETREAEQCRSHHQKMEKKYKYFSKILMSLRLQNYNSEDSGLILSDMQARGHQVSESCILSAGELKQISETSGSQQKQTETIAVRTPRAKITKSQKTNTTLPCSNANFQEMGDEQSGQGEQSLFGDSEDKKNEINNIFNDTYEKDLDWISFY